MTPDPALKQYIAQEIQSAITRRNVGPTFSPNAEYAQTMSGRVSSAVDSLTVDGNIQMSDEQRQLFQNILYTLEDIATTNRNTAKDRKDIRKMLAQIVAKSEVEKEKLKKEIDEKEQKIQDIANDAKLDATEKLTEIKRLSVEIRELEEKVKKEEKIQAEAKKADGGIGVKDLTAKQRFKKDLMADLRLMFPGVRWEQQQDESFGGMVKRTGKGVLSRGVTGVADALFGRATPKEDSLESMVAKEKLALEIKQKAENLTKKEEDAVTAADEKAEEQADDAISDGQVEQLELKLPPTITELRDQYGPQGETAGTVVPIDSAQADLFAPVETDGPKVDPNQTDLFIPKPQPTLEDLRKQVAAMESAPEIPGQVSADAADDVVTGVVDSVKQELSDFLTMDANVVNITANKVIVRKSSQSVGVSAEPASAPEKVRPTMDELRDKVAASNTATAQNASIDLSQVDLFATPTPVQGSVAPSTSPETMSTVDGVQGEFFAGQGPIKAKRTRGPRKKKYGSFIDSPIQTSNADQLFPQEAVVKGISNIFELLETLLKQRADEARRQAAEQQKKADEEKQKEEPKSDGGEAGPDGPPQPSSRPKRPRPSTPVQGGAVGKRGGRRAAQAVEKSLVQAGEKVAAKGAAKAAMKGAGKALVKKVPLLGAIAGLGFGAQRLLSGDIMGAAGEVLSGAASTVPGIGTAASFAIDGALAARDMAGSVQAQDMGIADTLEQLAEEQRTPMPDTAPALPALVNPVAVTPTRSETAPSISAPSATIRSPENSFVRFQDKRVARV